MPAPASRPRPTIRGAAREQEAARLAPAAAEKSAERPAAADKAPAKLPAAKAAEPGPAAGPKVVSIDAFRKK